MLTLGGFPNTNLYSPISLLPTRVNPLGFGTYLEQKHTGFCVYAVKSGRKGGNSLLEMGSFSDDFEEEEGNDDDEDENGFVPLKNMKRWLENKPRGFGEGKMYDTSIEDKLMEEIEQSRQAQLANVNMLENNPEKTTSNKQVQQQKDIPIGIRLRLSNLPKKKNIHRDLQLAFKGVSGILDIIPAVSGNNKTRDPICKGSAFVDFKSEDEANRFVRAFSKQIIVFGKIQKQIKYELVNPRSTSTAYEQSVDGSEDAPHLAVPILEGNIDASFGTDRSSDSWEETVSNEFQDDADDDYVQSEWEKTGEHLKALSVSKLIGDDSMEQRNEVVTDNAANLLSSKPTQKIRANGKKLIAKRKGEKVQKLNIPGSANRLKMKEKAVLKGVFTKYGVKSPISVKVPS